MTAIEERYESDAKTIFGFWIYIMTDCILFASLFAAFAVLHNNTYGGLPLSKLISMPFVLVETLLLLTSSFTSGLMMLAVHKNSKAGLYSWMGLTFLLGLGFLVMEIVEFHHLYEIGSSWKKSAALSSFFTLVGTHGMHITAGLLWILVLVGQLFFRGITSHAIRRLTCFSLFWHFLDIVWIFIFTIVYLMGAVTHGS
jgi:cytochrome o ubiquinol oxidase subunit 3